MIQQLSPALSQDSAPAENRPSGFRPTVPVAATALALLLITNGPLFVCMPLTNDTALYDLQAKTLREGGVLYRDILEPNLPGVVWIHAAVRAALGTSSEAMRLFDLAVYSVLVGLLAWWLATAGVSAAARVWFAFALFLYYFSISEWNHCQRDMWLLVPTLAGLHLRRRHVARSAEETRPRSYLAWGVLEGAVWGCGIWLKPMIFVPLVAVWAFSAAATLQPGGRRPAGPRVLADAAGLLAGGVLVGAAGVAWLHWSGAWPYFWQTLTEWNPRYFEAGKEHWTVGRLIGTVYRLLPWILLHLIAVPWAVRDVVAWILHPRDQHKRQTLSAMLGVVYLAWLAQSLFLQHLFDYIHAPGVLLAVAVLTQGLSFRAASALEHREANAPNRMWAVRWQWGAVGFLILAFLVSPAIRAERLGAWWACWTEGSTPEVRNRLAFFSYPHWGDLHDAANYLRQQSLQDGEVTCYNNNLVYLYEELNLRPSTRFVYLEALLIFFPERREEILSALAASRQRFLVTDLTAAGLRGDALRAGTQGENGSLPPAFPEAARRQFPWAYPVAYRAGSIVVHRIPSRPQP